MGPRIITCHVGPTNSGKTHEALLALSSAKTGIYCSPLRLLAWEIQEKLREKSIECGLLTGQENDIPVEATHISCTVEMAKLKQEFDVGVIDEVQLIGDTSRGWAWTQAFLGITSYPNDSTNCIR